MDAWYSCEFKHSSYCSILIGVTFFILTMSTLVGLQDSTQINPGPVDHEYQDATPVMQNNSETDIDTSSVICNLLFPDRICYWAHHKTGVELTKQIFMDTIATYCNYSDNARFRYSIRFINCMDNKFGIRTKSPPQSTISKISMLNVSAPNTATLFHFTRDPVATIVSGYLYHIRCPEYFIRSAKYSMDNINALTTFFVDGIKQTWTLKNIYEQLTYPDLNGNQSFPFEFESRLTTEQGIALNQFEGDKATEYIKIRYFYLYGAVAVVLNYTKSDWEQLDFYGFRNFDKNGIVLKECERYNFMQNRTLLERDGVGITFMELLRMIQRDRVLICGLYMEMMRYLFTTFIEQYELFNLRKIANTERVNRIELKMEDFVNDFDGNLDKILDGLNVRESMENQQKLRNLGHGDIDIGAERALLSEMIRKADPSYVMKSDMKERRHIHLSRNTEKYISVLLEASNGAICKLLRHITPLIGYKWKYDQFC